MKRMGKILSLFLTAAMAASCLAGCNSSDKNADTSSAGSKPSSSTDYDIYIYNSKGENAEQFKAMCEAYTEETGVKIKQFSIGSGQASHGDPKSRNGFKKSTDDFLHSGY